MTATRTLTTVAAAIAAALFAGSAGAALVTDPDSGLTLDTAPGVSYQQTLDDPCVIGGPDCSNPVGFPQTTAAAGGGGTGSDYWSPTYSIAQILGVIGATNAFTVGLDYNDTSVPQELRRFEAVYDNGSGTTSSQVFDVVTSLKTVYNGTGFSDFLMSGFLLPYTTGTVKFHAAWFNNDGRDNYFLIGAEPTIHVPEPAMLGLLGLGAAALGFAGRRRRTS